MAWGIGHWRLAVWVAVAAALGGCVREDPQARAARRLREASVVLMPAHCAGVAVSFDRVLTVAHCVQAVEQRVSVRTIRGELRHGYVAEYDKARDLAVVLFEAPLPVRPLPVASAAPAPGDTLYFSGRPDRRYPLQQATLRRLGRCPTLPQVPDALFTTVRAHKGDSGSPIIDETLRVVGLVHGGAACEIAAPVAAATELLEASSSPACLLKADQSLPDAAASDRASRLVQARRPARRLVR